MENENFGGTDQRVMDWAGLEDQVAQAGPLPDSLATRLVGYFRDCTVANQRSLRLVDVYEDREAQVLSLSSGVWDDVTAEGYIANERAALDLALANEVAPLEKPLLIGALFVVGRFQRPTGGRPLRVCAPLLIGSVSQARDANTVSFLLEGDIGLNLSLLATLTHVDRDNEEELQLRLESVMDAVPDAPFTTEEVSRFCTAVGDRLDVPFDVPAFGGFSQVDLAEELALQGPLRLLPASAIFIGKEAAELSVIRELDALMQLDADSPALTAVLDPGEPGVADADGAAEPVEMGGPTTHIRPADWHDDIEVVELTETQRRIVASARVEPLTVVTGPPGTGKSYTIAAVAMDHLLAEQTVLVTSGTSKAVDVVVERLERTGGPFAVAVSGDRTHQRALAQHIDEVSSAAGGPLRYPSTQLAAERERYVAFREDLRRVESRLEETLAREGALAFHAHSLEECADLASRFDLDVADPDRAERLRDQVRVTPDAGWWRRRQARRALDRLHKELRVGDTRVDAEEIERAVDLVRHHSEIVDIEAAVAADPHLHEGWQRLAEMRAELLTQGAKVLRMQRSAAFADLLDDHAARLALRKFSQALRTARHRAKKELLEQVPVEVLLRAFPCWASTDRFLSHILPLRPAMFDLVVVDEASQVDQAAAAPALLRGKRALIVGDPNQLRFVSFLSTAAETASLTRHEVPVSRQVTNRFSRRSLFDVAEDAAQQRAMFILDEHFRSEPHIISFSNREFYRRAMRLMTERPHSSGSQAIDIRYIGGSRAAPANRNSEELEEALRIVGDTVAEAERGGPIKTLGLLSPYRDQANALNRAVAERLTPEQITRHKVTTGTAHSLQGDERDVVVLSTVLDPGYHASSLRFLEDPNLLNVAITRAAQKLVVVTSLRPEHLPSGDSHYLAKFFEHAANPADPESLPDTFRSKFESEVADGLRARGVRVISNYPSCGFEIDLVASNGQASVAIECDGHPSHFNADGTYTTDDIQRHVILARAGWTIYRIPLSSWRSNAEHHLAEITRWLDEPPTTPSASVPELPPPDPPSVVTASKTSRSTATRGAANTTRGTRKRVTSRSAGKKVPVTSSRCPCGGRWVLRTGPYGKFYGCSRYPRCRKTRNFR